MHEDAPELNSMAEFRSPALEHAFFHSYIFSARLYIAYACLTVGVLYLALGFFDLFVLRQVATAPINFTMRGCILLCSLGVYFTAKNSKSAKTILHTYLTFAVILVVSYQVFLYTQYRMGYGRDFMEIAIAFLIVDLACFLLPNRWVYSVIFALSVAVMFLSLTSLYMVEVTPNQTLGVSTYFLFIIVLGGMFARSLHRQRRLHYYRVRQLERLAGTDPLTGIYNRQKFDEVLNEWLGRGGEPEGFSVIMFDLDGFKRLNDDFGHMVGDEVLVGSVHAARAGIRSRDIFARWGGEEFMILLPGTPLAAALGTAERLRATLERFDFPSGARVTASFGVTTYRPGDSSDSIITRVDGCLYRAKQEGKNRVCTDETEEKAGVKTISLPEIKGNGEGDIRLFGVEEKRA